MRSNIYYSNATVAALVMASVVRCGGRIKRPCTGAPLFFQSYRSRR
jgi:hypothetical protein